MDSSEHFNMFDILSFKMKRFFMPKTKLLSVLTIMLVIWLLIPFLVMFIFKNLEKASQFSDIFNIISSLFSGLGFVAIVFTINLQQAEFQNELSSINKANRLNYLTTLLSFYSSEEEKYQGNDVQKTQSAKLKKEEILLIIEKEITDGNKPKSI